MRKLLAGLLMSVIVFASFALVTPHDDFGDAAHAHGTVATGTGSIDLSDDKPADQGGYPAVHCLGIAHLFMMAELNLPTFLASRESFSPSNNDLSPSQIIIPSPPPPNV